MSEIHFNNELHDKPDWVYDDMTMRGEYVSVINPDNFDNDTRYDFDEDPVQLDSILALQSLAMGSLRHAARVKKRGDAYNRRHGFSILSESSRSDEVYDGATEEYMTYRIAKNGFADWSMRVRFRSNERVYDKRQTSSLDDYYFSWRRGSDIVSASLDSHVVSSDGYTTEDRFDTIRKLSNKEVLELRERMFQHVEKSGAWPEGSFLKPQLEARYEESECA